MVRNKRKLDKMKQEIREFLQDKEFFIAFLIGTANATGNSVHSATAIGWAMDLPHEIESWPDGFIDCAIAVFEELTQPIDEDKS